MRVTCFDYWAEKLSALRPVVDEAVGTFVRASSYVLLHMRPRFARAYCQSWAMFRNNSGTKNGTSCVRFLLLRMSGVIYVPGRFIFSLLVTCLVLRAIALYIVCVLIPRWQIDLYLWVLLKETLNIVLFHARELSKEQRAPCSTKHKEAPVVCAHAGLCRKKKTCVRSTPTNLERLLSRKALGRTNRCSLRTEFRELRRLEYVVVF